MSAITFTRALLNPGALGAVIKVVNATVETVEFKFSPSFTTMYALYSVETDNPVILAELALARTEALAFLMAVPWAITSAAVGGVVAAA